MSQKIVDPAVSDTMFSRRGITGEKIVLVGRGQLAGPIKPAPTNIWKKFSRKFFNLGRYTSGGALV